MEIDFLKEMDYSNVEGLEVVTSFLRADIHIEPDSIGFLENNPERWDVIFARESVYYVPKENQQRLWKAFFLGLKPGGKLVVIVFNGALTTSEWIIQKDHGIKFALNEISLLNLGEIGGFHDIEIEGVKPQHRSPVGATIFMILSLYRNLTSRLRYLSERGIDRQNPRYFTKSIVLIAKK
jgi:hypothetical protein